MTCEDIELALSEMPQTLPREVVAHLRTCASCTDTARVLSLAVLPELTAVEHGRLSQMPMATQAAWRRQESSRLNFRRVAGYALAAGLGALITASVFSFSASGHVGAAGGDKTAKGGDGESRQERREEMGRKARMFAVVGIADALELNEADALKLTEKLRVIEDKRKPIREGMGESMKSLKAATDGDTAALARVDADVIARRPRAIGCHRQRHVRAALSGSKPREEGPLGALLGQVR